MNVDSLFEQMTAISKASAYDAIQPEYKRLQEVNGELLHACKRALSFLEIIEVRGDLPTLLAAVITKATQQPCTTQH